MIDVEPQSSPPQREKTNLPAVSILILNWNGWGDTIECLESVFHITYPNFEVCVIDNGSKDDSLRKIREYCNGVIEIHSDLVPFDSSSKPIRIIEYTQLDAESGGRDEDETTFMGLPSKRRIKLILNQENLGFAEGNNVGIRHALKTSRSAFVLLLNNDTVVDPGFLSELVTAATQSEEIGFAGPKTYYYDFCGRKDVISAAGCGMTMWKATPIHIGKNEIDNGQYESSSVVDHVGGTCLLVRNNVIRTIGLLDASLFAYWEENDWCRRGRDSGYLTVYVPKAKIWHKIGRSDSAGWREFYATRNMFWFMKKHATRIQLFSFLLYFFTWRFWIRFCTLAFYDRDEQTLLQFLSGVLHGVRNY